MQPPRRTKGLPRGWLVNNDVPESNTCQIAYTVEKTIHFKYHRAARSKEGLRPNGKKCTWSEENDSRGGEGSGGKVTLTAAPAVPPSRKGHVSFSFW